MNNRYDRDNGMNVLSALIVGVAAGAAAMFLSDKNNRKMVAKKLQKMLDESDKHLSEMEEKFDEVKETGKKKLLAHLDNGKKEIEKK